MDILALQTALAERTTEVAELRESNALLLQRLTELEQKLAQNSKNSSKPPSSDGPFKVKKGKSPSGKKRGGQIGHKAHYRALYPRERVNEHVFVRLTGDCRCGVAHVHFQKPRRHQVAELPCLQPVVTEYLLQQGRCSGCKRVRCAPLPHGVKPYCLGPKATSVLAHLTSEGRMSKAQARNFLQSVFHIRVATSTVSNFEGRVASMLELPDAQIAKHIDSSPVQYVDETPFQRGAAVTTAWVRATSDALSFRVGKKRNAASHDEVMAHTNETSIVMSDRYVVYGKRLLDYRALCLEHLKRNLFAIEERGGFVGQKAGIIKQAVIAAMRLDAERRRGLMEEFEFQEKVFLEKNLIYETLKGILYWGHDKIKALAHVFIVYKDAVWRFVNDIRVEPTNNRGERGLRSLVIYRKTSFFTQSIRGDRFLERSSSVAGTCKLKKMNPFHYLCDVVKAAWINQPPPPLIRDF